MWIACYYLPDFSIACEQALRPDLRGTPLALVGDDGALCALSTEAAEAGVRQGRTPSAARMFCPDLIVLPYNRPRYEEMAEPLWDRIACDSSFVEPASPEMCFAAFTGAGVYERVLAVADDIREIARTPVRTGMAFSRFTARIAAMRDPGGSPVVTPKGSEARLLATVPIEDLPQISREERERLKRLGVHVLGDVLTVQERDLYRVFRERSLLLRRLARGLDREPIRALWPPDCVEHALHLDTGITEETMLHEALRRCARHVSEKLIRRGRRCRSVSLILRSETGRTRIQTEKLQAPKSDEESLFRTALRLLGRMPPLSSPWKGEGERTSPLPSPWKGEGERTSPLPSPWKGEGVGAAPLSSLRRGDGGEVTTAPRSPQEHSASGTPIATAPHNDQTRQTKTASDDRTATSPLPSPWEGEGERTSPLPSPWKGEGERTSRLPSPWKGEGVGAIDPPTSVILRAVVAEATDSVQRALFDENRVSDVLPHERLGRLDAAMGLVGERFGKNSVCKATGLRRAMPFQLWTYPLTRRMNESIEVATDRSGNPVRYRRNGAWWNIAHIQNRWSEAGWMHGRLEERMVFRVETFSIGLAELRRCGGEWRLTAVAD